jgi:hypothetical protein
MDMKHDSTRFITGSVIALPLLGALVPAEPATAQTVRQVAIVQCAVVSDPPGSSPEIQVVAFSRSAEAPEVPAVQLGRDCARGLRDLLSKKFVIKSTLGDQAAGTVLYTLTKTQGTN